MHDLPGYLLFCALLSAGGWALAAHMARAFAGQPNLLSPALAPIERGIYRLSGSRPETRQGWKAYAAAVLVFNGLGFLARYAILRLQGALPLNPDGIGGMAPDLAFNTAISFVTNTNWQAYSREAQLSGASCDQSRPGRAQNLSRQGVPY